VASSAGPIIVSPFIEALRSPFTEALGSPLTEAESATQKEARLCINAYLPIAVSVSVSVWYGRLLGCACCCVSSHALYACHRSRSRCACLTILCMETICVNTTDTPSAGTAVMRIKNHHDAKP
jgi:hypothetical protein